MAPRLIDPYLRGDERVSLNVALNLPAYSATNGPYNVTGFPYQSGIGGFWVHPPFYYLLISPIASRPFLCRVFSLSLAYLNLILVYLLTEKHFWSWPWHCCHLDYGLCSEQEIS